MKPKMYKLEVATPLNSQAQLVLDNQGNKSALQVSTDFTALSDGKRLKLGVSNGSGEWIEDTWGVDQQVYGISFFAAGKEFVRLVNNGNLGVGTTTPKATLTVNGSVQFSSITSGKSSSADLVVDQQGNVGVQGSSLRFKEQVSGLQDEFQKILQLSPISFRYKDGGAEAIGYAAEELDEKDLKHLVTYDDEGRPFSIDYKMISVYLVEVLKAQEDKLRSLQARFSELQHRLESLAAAGV